MLIQFISQSLLFPAFTSYSLITNNQLNQPINKLHTIYSYITLRPYLTVLTSHIVWSSTKNQTRAQANSARCTPGHHSVICIQLPTQTYWKPAPRLTWVSKPFRLFDLPYEIRSQRFFFSICSTDNYWLDREVISLGESLRLVYFIRGRVVWRGSNGVFLRLLLSSRLIYNEVTQMLFSRFAFDARGWGYMLKYSNPSKGPSSNYLPKHRIKHIVYTPYRTEYLREHQDSAKRPTTT